ncbi:virion structural protein [Moorella phage MTATph1]
MGSPLYKLLENIVKDKQKDGFVKSAAEYQQELTNLVSMVAAAGTQPLMQLRFQSGRTSSADYNRTAEEIYTDLNRLFLLYNTIDQAVHDHQWLLTSQLNNLELGVNRINGYLNVLPPQENQGRTFIYEDFANPAYTETSMEELALLRLDRDGKSYGFLEDAVAAGSLTLRPLINNDCLISVSGYPLAQIELKKTIGTPLPQVLFPLANAIDGSPVTFWQETVWAPAPLEVAPVVALSTAPEDSVFYGDASYGAFAELWITFKYPVLISELSLTPNCTYPLQLVRAFAYEGKTSYHEIASNLTLPTTLQFPAVTCSYLRLLLCQEHYEKKTYLLSSSQIQDLVLENNLEQKLWFPDEKDVEERNYLEQYPNWSDYRQVVDNGLPQEDPVLTLNCCEYEYGLRELSVREKHYHDIGFYISRPFTFEGDARLVELEAEEIHQEVDIAGNKRRVTAVEYYIGADGGWFPILPKGQTVISERLFGAKPELRFPVVSDLKIYQNGVPFNDYQVIDSQHLLITNFSDNSIYTADYTPEVSAYVVDLGQLLRPKDYNTGSHRGEYFEGTNPDGTLQLSHVPFVDYGTLDNPVSVLVAEGDKFVEYKNISDYYYGGFRKPGDREFCQVGRKLFFAAPISTPIWVYYRYLGSDIRLKIILRRNIFGFDTLTPVVKNYRLQIAAVV